MPLRPLGHVTEGVRRAAWGRASCVSFDPTKVVASFGSAGALLCDEAAVAEKARMLRYHGRNITTGTSDFVGFNSQLATDKAAVLNFKLSRMEEWRKRREQIAQTYLQGLQEIEEVTLPRIRPGSSHTWHKFVIQAANRDRLADQLRKMGVDTRVHYSRALIDEPCLRGLVPETDALPVTRAMRRKVLSCRSMLN